MLFGPDVKLVKEHSQWLSGFNRQYLKNWEGLLSADPEAAMCEAQVRQVLQQNGNTVEPNEDLTGRAQACDFRCVQGGKTFLTEVTCLSIAKVTKATGLPDEADGKACYYGSLNDAIFEASRKKTPQCAGLGHPVLVAVGTFHFQASALCFSEHNLQMLLTGEELITQRVDTRTGQSVGDIYLSTKLWSATFLRPNEETGMEYARCPISAMLLCGFGCSPFQV